MATLPPAAMVPEARPGEDVAAGPYCIGGSLSGGGPPPGNRTAVIVLDVIAQSSPAAPAS